MEQRIGFCTAPDGVRIALTTGDGPPLVKASNWLSHLDMDWDTPVWRHWWREMSRDHTFVRYDQRGCGMSDWSVDDFSFDARVSHLEAVVDHLELPRFDLLGVSHGGPIAIEYAVRHPERVRSLVLFGTFARGAFKRGGEAAEERRAMITLMRTGWGRDNPSTRQIFTSRLMPDGTEEAMRSLNDLQRLSTTPENAAAISTATGDMDVVERLPQVTAPTLGLHSRGDAMAPFEEGRVVAAIPGAKFVALESRNHLLLETEPAWQVFLTEVRAFLGVEVGPPATPLQAPPASYPDGLTAREIDVLRLIAQGNRNAQIGEALFISAKTVAQHVTGILAKTGSSNRAEAATYAARHGLV